MTEKQDLGGNLIKAGCGICCLPFLVVLLIAFGSAIVGTVQSMFGG